MNRNIINNLLVLTVFALAAITNPEAQAYAAGADSIENRNRIAEGTLFNTHRENTATAVSSVSGGRLYQTVSADLPNTLTGQVPGLGVRMGNGQPGYNSTEWLIRGIGSYTYGRANESKIFIDGFESSAEYLAYMLPCEIESISVLKDAGALTPFGMTGSNGVIWVTTKRGRIGAPQVNIKVRTSLQQPININKPLDAYDYATLYNQAYSNDNGMVWTPYYSDDVLAGYRNGTQPNIDWYDQILRKNANYSDVAASVSGGGHTARYNIVMGYSNHQGLLDVQNSDHASNLNMGRFNLRANLDMELFDIFEVKVDIGGRLEERKAPNYNIWNLFEDVAKLPANTYWVFDDTEGQNYSGTAVYPNNPRGSIRGLGWYSSRTRITQANFSIREKLDFITPGLYLEESFSFYSRSRSTYSKTKNYTRYNDGKTTTTDQDSPLTASWYNADGMLDWKQAKATLGYERVLGRHRLNGAAAFHISDRKNDGQYEYKIHYMNIFGRLNYNYDSRYTAELGFSSFGTDAYTGSNKWGFYPSLSAAWVISNENFLKAGGPVDFLKLRASVGMTGGNEAGSDFNVNGYYTSGRYLYQQYFYWNNTLLTGTSAPYVGNGSVAPRFIANPGLKPEKSLKYNLGLDVTLWKNLDITADFFLDKRRDIITIDNTIMGYYGNIYYVGNIGKMTNKGLELGLSYNGKAGEFTYSLYGMFSTSVNKIDYMAEPGTPHPYNAATGHPFGARFGLVSEGFYQVEDFDDKGNLVSGIPVPTFGSVQPGDLKYADLDGDGYIDDTDIMKVGNPYYSKMYYSFGLSGGWRGFDLNVMFRGAAGSTVNLLDYYSQFVTFMNNQNAYKIAQGAWAYYPNKGIDNRANAAYPRLTTVNNNNNYRNSSFWVRKNNFLRIQNIELGYEFAGNVVNSKNISSLRLFGNVTNPVTWSRLLKDYNMDPETFYGYPSLRSFTVGISIGF